MEFVLKRATVFEGQGKLFQSSLPQQGKAVSIIYLNQEYYHSEKTMWKILNACPLEVTFLDAVGEGYWEVGGWT